MSAHSPAPAAARPAATRVPPIPTLPVDGAAAGIVQRAAVQEAATTQAMRLLASGTLTASLALSLGAGHLAIAVIAALPFAGRIGQLAVPTLVARYGVGLVAHRAAWAERAGYTFAALAGLLHPPAALLWLLVGYAVASAAVALYDGATTALVATTAPGASRGQFTAGRTRWGSLAGLAAASVGGFLLDVAEGHGMTPSTARSLMLGLGALIGLHGARYLWRWRTTAGQKDGVLHTPPRSAPTPPHATSLAEILPWPLSATDRRIIALGLAWGLGLGISARQSDMLGMTVLGYSVGSLTLLNGLLVGCQALGATLWGRLIDRFGGRPVWTVSHLWMALDPLFVIAGALVHPLIFAVSYLSFGVANGGLTLGHVDTLVGREDATRERGLRRFALYHAAFGVAACVAPLVGGVILHGFSGFGARWSFVALFVTSLGIRLWSVRFLRRLPPLDPRPVTGSRYVRQVMWRALRQTAHTQASTGTPARRVLGLSVVLSTSAWHAGSSALEAGREVIRRANSWGGPRLPNGHRPDLEDPDVS